MKVMFVSKAFKGNLGADLHYKAVLELFGNENVYTVDLRQLDAYEKWNYKAYGKYKSKSDRILRWLQGNMMWISNAIIADIVKLIKEFKPDLVYIEDSVFGNLTKNVKKAFPNIKVVSFYHDIKGNLYKQWKRNSGLVNKIEYSIGIRQEKLNQQFCDVNIVFNKRDAELFKSVYGKYPEEIVALPAPRVPIDEKIKNAVTDADQRKTLLFVGKKYGPNITGLNWFVNTVLPSLSDNIQIQIVGRGLEFLRQEYTDERINVVGEVDSLTPYYENADIVFAPLFEGGGMKSKTVEALSFGKTFVGTKESLFGFWEEMDESIRMKEVYQCDKAEEWIRVLNNLTGEKTHKLNDKTYRLFLEKFSYESAKEKFSQILLQEAGQ